MRNGEVTTRLGYWLRRLRLDELPQLWSVVRGQQSLIGPRPERPDYSELYRQQLPYYDVRHLIPPGLSGWAQLYHENHPHFQPALDATAEKLSYDLYYVKNRNFWLDLKIALKTIKVLLSVKGI
jgi:lipopolysaccharide/colanic/teichoic acid biosynthesis glycosyltransferase